jgi:hypothetical protein
MIQSVLESCLAIAEVSSDIFLYWMIESALLLHAFCWLYFKGCQTGPKHHLDLSQSPVTAPSVIHEPAYGLSCLQIFATKTPQKVKNLYEIQAFLQKK